MGFIPEERKEIYSYLWNGELRSELPPGVWEAPLDVHALARMYEDCLNPRERASFDNLVRWTGGDNPPLPPPSDPDDDPGPPSTFTIARMNLGSTDGYCYEVAFVPSAKERARAKLGRNPRGPALAELLLDEPGIWAPGKFRLTFSREVKANGRPPFIQAHLAVSDLGCPLSTLLPFFSSAIRVGSDGDRALLAVPPQPTVSTGRPTMFDLVPVANPETIHLGAYTVMSRADKSDSFGWSPFKSVASAIMLGMYESVRLKSADMVFYLPKGSANAVYFAVTGNDNGVTGNAWFSAPLNDTYQGSDQGAVSYRWSLPTNHPFGKEYRSGVLGTGPPRFHFALSSTATGEVRVMADFVFEVAGQIPIERFNMQSSGAKGVAHAVRSTIPSYARMGLVAAPRCGMPAGPEDEDSSSDDEKPAERRAVRSPKAA